MIKNINIEEFLINKILFEENLKDLDVFNNINYELLTKILSEHLIIPSFYINIKRKKIDNIFESEFLNFCKGIYEINKNKNKLLKEEIIEISKILKAHKIKHLFIKGASHILSNLYEDIGERMIGDIDIWIPEDEIQNAKEIMKNNGYNKINKYSFSNPGGRHLDRMLNQNKLYSIELHRRPLREKKFHFDKIKVIEKDSFNIISLNDQLLINIYNHQINDFGLYKLSYSYRNLYDTYLFLKKKIVISNDCYDPVINYYFLICKKLNIKEMKNHYTKENLFFNLRFYLKKFKILRLIHDFTTVQIIKIKYRPKQIKRLILSKNYRQYLIEKYFKIYLTLTVLINFKI
tara:strand:- start:15028 stop:16068 length:1041 start_codon:yes stop_codon:yes gene_type:complete